MHNKETEINVAELEAIFDHLPDGIITIRARLPHVITSINNSACKILNADKSQLLGKQIKTIFTEPYSPLLQLVRETLEQKRAIRNFGVAIEDGEAEPRTYLINTVLIDEAEPDAGKVIIILHDVSETNRLRPYPVGTQRFETLIGSTPQMKRVFSLIETVAPTDAAVLIYGETGTGKELVARAIHQRSDRAKGPFVPVHCSAITSSLLESDLFGHTRGAFTGAIRDKPGRFEMADGGTIFLDEVATLSHEIQVSLLRVLQEKTIERVGDTKVVSVDVRIISATNRQLPELIRQQVFRKDLYYRLKVLQINLPPLRKRKTDIPVLADHFIEKFNQQHGCNILGISNDTIQLLKAYPWPGNVRELENAIEHAVIICKSNLIEPWHLPEEIRESERGKLTFAVGGSVQLSEADRIRKALKQTAGNVTRAAELLGVHRTTLWRKMREFDIPRLAD